MKIRLTFKTPDAIDQVLSEIEDEDQRESVKSTVEKWVEYGEYLTVEIDTLNGSCIPIPVRK